MPIRIKPNFDLGLCVLNLHAIKGIISSLDNNFTGAKFSANYDYKEIYDESGDVFLDFISELDNLDSFSAKASGDIKGSLLSLELIFNDVDAKISFVALPEHETWIEHFMIDLKKLLLPQTFLQKTHVFLNSYHKRELKPYSRIILKQKPANPLIENIKANIVSNFIWVILGMVFLYIIQNI
ncbi:MAG: hypothetical protein ACOWWR_12220 [Eubacteriales bacterium]